MIVHEYVPRDWVFPIVLSCFVAVVVQSDDPNAATDLASILKNAGYSVQFISLETLASLGTSSPSAFKLLVLPHARPFRDETPGLTPIEKHRPEH